MAPSIRPLANAEPSAARATTTAKTTLRAMGCRSIYHHAARHQSRSTMIGGARARPRRWLARTNELEHPDRHRASQLGRTSIYIPTASRIATASAVSSLTTEDEARAEK